MENLSESEERMWKVLSQFPHGTNAKRLEHITSMSKTVVYEALKGLHSKGFVDHKKRLWIIKEKPSTEVKPSKNWIFPSIACVLIVFFSVVFSIGFIDPSLKLFNDTIINPFKAFGPYAIWPLLAMIVLAMLQTRRH